MSNNTLLNIGSGGDAMVTVDVSPFAGYPTSGGFPLSGGGKIEPTCLYVGSGWSGQPQPLSLFNPLYAQLVSGNNPIGSVVASGSVAILSGSIIGGVYSPVPVSVASGQGAYLETDSAGSLLLAGRNSPVAISVASGQSATLQIDPSGNLKTTATVNVTVVGSQVSGAVQVSGIVGVSGQVMVTSGTYLPVWIASGNVTTAVATSVTSGSVIVSGSVQVSGAVIVSGNVGVSGSVQILSGSAWGEVIEGVFNPVPVGVSSGQAYALQIDGSGASLLVGGRNNPVAISVGSGQLASLQIDSAGNLKAVDLIQSGLIGILSGNIGATVSGSVQVSGAVIVSGNVGVSGSVQILSGSAAIGQISSGGFPIGTMGVNSGLISVLSGLVGVLSGSVGATVSGSVQVSGAVIVSGNVGVSGSVQILSGGFWMGVTEGVFNPVPVGVSSGQAYPLQIDGSGASLLVGGRNNPVAISIGSGQLASLQIDAAGYLKAAVLISGSPTVSGSVQVSGAVIVSGNVGVSGSVQILSGAGTIGQIGSGGFTIGSIIQTSGLIAILSGNIGATISGSVQVSGAVIVSGNVGILSGTGVIGQIGSGGFPLGTIGITSGLVALLSGFVGATVSGSVQVSGAVIVSGNVGISGAALLLSGNANVGNVILTPGFSGGPAIFRAFSGLGNTGSGIQIQSGAGRLISYRFNNTSFSGLYLKFWDNTAAPTVGTTTPIITEAMGQNEKSPWYFPGANMGLQYMNGLWCQVAGLVGDSDTTNCSGQSGLLYTWVVFRSGF